MTLTEQVHAQAVLLAGQDTQVQEALNTLLATLPARYVLISYNSEGFITLPEMQTLLKNHGKVKLMETDYATFRGCRNLRARSLSVKEYLFLLRK